MILKTLFNQNYVDKWPDIIDGVLFAHRTVRHESTKYSPFFLLYNREPALPIDINLEELTSCTVDVEEDDPVGTKIIPNEVDQLYFEKHLEQILQIQSSIFSQAASNIKKSQVKQQKAYDTRHSNKKKFKVGSLVLLRNCLRNDRKGGWSKAPFTGPYTIIKIQQNNNCILKTMKGKIIKKKHPISNLKNYIYKGSMKKHLKKKQDSNSIEILSDNEPIDKKLIIPSIMPPKDSKTLKFISDGTTFRFHPINNKWQKEQCERLNLIYVQNDKFKSNKNSILHIPVECASIVPDGNCFFRAISLCITGSEVQQNVVRKKIIEFMKLNSKKVEEFTNNPNYITSSCMENDTVWATEVEIYFTAAFINADIYSFTTNSVKNTTSWIRFSHSLLISQKPEYHKMAIYLNHKNSNHFEVVLKVKKMSGFNKENDDIYLTANA